MKKKTLVIIGIVLLVLAGVGFYFYQNQKKALLIIFPEIKEVEHIGVRLLKDTAKIKLSLNIQNQSFLKLNIDSIQYLVLLDTSTVLDRAQKLGLVLQPGEKVLYDLPFDLSVSGIRNQIKALQERDSMNISVKARAVYSTILGNTSLKMEKDYMVKVPTPPKIEVLSTEYKKRDGKTFFVDARVRILNKGDLDLELSQLNYRIDVSDLFFAEDVKPMHIHIKPKTSKEITLPIKLEFNKLLKTAFLVLTNKDKVPYHLKISAVINADSISKDSAPIEVVKDGILELRK